MTKSNYSKAVLLFLLISLLFGFCNGAESPYKTDWTRDGLIIGVGLGSAVVSSAFDSKVTPISAEEISKLDKSSINAFDRWATNNYSTSVSSVSDALAVGLVFSPLVLLAGNDIQSDFWKLSMMYAETLLFSVFLPSYTKNTVGRIRPFVYNPNAPIEKKYDVDNRRSFFSGHTCVAFSSAVFLATVYSDYYPESKYKNYIWGASLLAASSVGILRIEAGAHFPTDVIAGAVVGSAVGWAIPALHRTNADRTGASVNISPSMISFTYNF